MRLAEIIVNFIYRMVFGVICIYFLNLFFQIVDLNLQVGLNAWTAAITGVLGFPGVVLLFAVRFIGLL